MPANKSFCQHRMTGFTLLELVMGIVVFALALGLFSSLIVPQAKQSADPILQVRASELAQSLMNEISSKSFDENANRSGGQTRCGENANLCTSDNDFGADSGETALSLYDDVDDYHGVNDLGFIFGAEVAQRYQGFDIGIQVSYAEMDNSSPSGNTKRIELTITSPNNERFVFSAFRSNY